MTNDFKEKLLAYLTGKLKKETGNNTPQFGEVSEVGNNLYTYLSTKTFRPYPKAIIRGKNSTGEDLDIYLLYGNDRTENDTYEGFIVILDKNYMPIQFINQFTSGVRFGNIEILKVGDNGRFYGVELTTETTTKKEDIITYLMEDENNSVVGQVKLYITKNGKKVNGTCDITTKSGTTVTKIISKDGYVTNKNIITKIENIKVS